MAIHITTERLLLREPGRSDLNAILAFVSMNKMHVKQWEPFRTNEYYSIDGQLDRLENLLKNNNEIKLLLFVRGKENAIVGEIELSNIVRGPFQNCNIGYKLDQREVGKGYMQEAMRATIEYVFEKLKLHRIEANIIPKNHKSIKLVERLGFKYEGLCEKLLKINGRWEDHRRYALLNEE